MQEYVVSERISLRNADEEAPAWPAATACMLIMRMLQSSLWLSRPRCWLLLLPSCMPGCRLHGCLMLHAHLCYLHESTRCQTRAACQHSAAAWLLRAECLAQRSAGECSPGTLQTAAMMSALLGHGWLPLGALGLHGTPYELG